MTKVDPRDWRVWVLLGACLVQLGMVVGMIASSEDTIEGGRAWNFRTRPVDPVDFFRGRYVRLRFAGRWYGRPVDATGKPEIGQRVFAALELDAEGFAQLAAISMQRPETPDYLEVEVKGVNGSVVSFDLPFDRFYMDESKAQAVEQQINQRGSRSWAIVRVKHGKSVVEDLHIELESVEEFSAQHLRVWPESAVVPDSLPEAMTRVIGSWIDQACVRGDCALLEVSLDSSRDSEYVFWPGRGRRFHYFAGSDADRDGVLAPNEWRSAPMLPDQGREPADIEELVQRLSASGLAAEEPRTKWLRVGDLVLRPTL